MSVRGIRKKLKDKPRSPSQPSIVLVVFLLVGCLLGGAVLDHNSPWTAASIPAFCILAFVQPSPITFAAAGVVIGIANRALKKLPVRSLPVCRKGGMTIHGKVLRCIPSVYGRKTVEINVRHVMGRDAEPVNFRLLVQVPVSHEIYPGAEVLLRVFLKRVDLRDFRETAIGEVKNGGWLLKNEGSWPPAVGRKRFSEVLDNFRHDPSSGLLGSFSLGERWRIDGRTREILRKNGTYHFLAISGVHIGAAAIPFFLLVRFGASLSLCARPRRVRALLLMLWAAAVGCYLGFTGHSTPALRAAVYLGLGGSAFLSARRSRAQVTLSWCLAVIVFFSSGPQPDVSLTLSALAVTGILLGRGGGKGYLPALLQVTLGATLFTLPVTVWFAGGIPTFAPVGNIAAGIPFGLFLIPFAVLLDLASLVPVFPLEPAAGFWLKTAYPVHSLMASLADLPFSFTHLSETGCILASAAAVAGLVLWWRKGFRPGPGIIIYLTIIAFSAVGQALVARLDTQVLSISFPSAGQADSTVIRYRGKTVLIDCGPSGLPGRDSPTARTLQKMGIGRIDALFLSHDHPDHTGGFEDIFARWPIETVYLPFGFKGFRERIPPSATGKVPEIRYLKYGDEVKLAGLTFQVFGPRKEEISPTDINRGSLLLLLCVDEFSALFTGDAGWDQVGRSLLRIQDLTLLKVPHHGSRKGFLAPGLEKSLERVIRRRGLVAVFPSKRPGSRPLPAPEIVDWFRKKRAKLEFTGEKGVRILVKKGVPLLGGPAVVDIHHWF